MYKIVETKRGFLAISPKPAGEPQLRAAIARLKSDGVTSVVSLLESREAENLGLALERSECEQQALRFDHYPITDFGVPADANSFHELIGQLCTSIDAGERVLVHCHGGVGRSGLVAVAVLQHRGHELGAALELCSKKRGERVPETPGQRAWLEKTHFRNSGKRLE